MEKGKYLNIWKKELPFILSAIQKGGDQKEIIPKVFQQSGKRKSYGFRLDITNGVVPTKQGTAVARDLKEVLDCDLEFRNITNGKYIIIRMGKDFVLEVKVIS